MTFSFNVEIQARASSTPPGLQVYAFSNSLNLVGYSDYRKSSDAFLGECIKIERGQISIAFDSITSDVVYLPIIIRVPAEESIFNTSTHCEYKCQVGIECFKSEKLTLEDGSDVDWMVLGVLCLRRKEGSLTLSRIDWKDVSSFPERPGDFIHQLKDLIDSLQSEPITSESWSTLWVANSETESSDISSPRTVASNSPKNTGTITFAPGSPTGHCRECSLKDIEILALKHSMEQKAEEVRKLSQVKSSFSPRSVDRVADLSNEIERMREREKEMLLAFETQKILIDRLRHEKKISLCDNLVGEAIPMTSDDLVRTGLKTDLDVAVQLVQQEELIVAIKDQMLKLMNQIKNRYRLREIKSLK
jgi:hypothetical protein